MSNQIIGAICIGAQEEIIDIDPISVEPVASVITKPLFSERNDGELFAKIEAPSAPAEFRS